MTEKNFVPLLLAAFAFSLFVALVNANEVYQVRNLEFVIACFFS